MINGIFVQLTGTIIAILIVLTAPTFLYQMLCKQYSYIWAITGKTVPIFLTIWHLIALSAFHLSDFSHALFQCDEKSCTLFRMNLSQALLGTREFNSFKIMSSFFNSVLHNIKSFCYYMVTYDHIRTLFSAHPNVFIWMALAHTHCALQPIHVCKLIFVSV